MKIIGLTGSIGMGKSVTASLLRHLGVAVHDSDAAVHVALSAAAVREVVKAFPSALDKKNNRIDRAGLGKIIFSDSQKRRRLEAIIHPYVWASQRNFIRAAKQRGERLVVLEIPLLFETGADQRCDFVICVTAPPFLQRLRVLSQERMSEERFHDILKNQVSDAEKRKRADLVIHTGLGRAQTLQALKKMLKLFA